MKSMKPNHIIAAGMGALLALTSTISLATPTNHIATTVEKTSPADNHAKSNMLYALSAESGSFDNNKLTLNGVKLVLYFTEAPKRIAGQIGPEKFDEIWNSRINTGKTKKPNAVLSLFDTNENNNAIIELKSQELKDGTFTYDVTLLKGTPDHTFGKATLFIDAFPCAVNGC